MAKVIEEYGEKFIEVLIPVTFKIQITDDDELKDGILLNENSVVENDELHELIDEYFDNEERVDLGESVLNQFENYKIL